MEMSLSADNEANFEENYKPIKEHAQPRGRAGLVTLRPDTTDDTEVGYELGRHQHFLPLLISPKGLRILQITREFDCAKALKMTYKSG